MNQSTKRVAGTIVLMVLVFMFSTLGISRISNNKMLSYQVNPNAYNSQHDVNTMTAGNEDNESQQETQNGENELIQLTVTIFEEGFGEYSFVHDSLVNVTLVRDELEIELELAEITQEIERQIIVASGLTDRSGTVTFEIPSGNYTVLTEHWGLLGNISISLISSKPEASLVWIFRQRFENPLIVQINDSNTDGWITPNETVEIFYRGDAFQKPCKVFMVAKGQRIEPIDLTFEGISSLPHGVYFDFSPSHPILIGNMTSIEWMLYESISDTASEWSLLNNETSDSELEIGIIWYEVSVVD